MRKVLRDESSARCPHCIMANERGLGGGGGGGGGGGVVTKVNRANLFILFFMNLYLILHAFFQIIFLDILVSIFILSLKVKGNSVFGWQRRAQIPIIKMFCSVSGGEGMPSQPSGEGCAPGPAPFPHTPPFSPLYTRPSRICGSGFSSPCVH